ncbi:rhomboid family protein [Halocalculus aciditolerans]|nr:hypothetical protein [Halocalculus aciditolerans]
MAIRGERVDEDVAHAPQVPLDGRDAALLLVPLLALTALYCLPDALVRPLALSHLNPEPWSFYTAHFVHFSRGHFLNDAAAYLLLAPTAYLLFTWADDRAFFRRAFLTVLLAFPVALSAVGLALPRRVVTYGFSGLAMALFGLVGVAAFRYLETCPGDIDLGHAPGLFFAATTAIPLLVLPHTPTAMALTAASALPTAYYTRSTVRALPRDARQSIVHRPGAAELPGFAAFLVLASPFAAFPPNPFAGAVTVDIFLHFVGFALGFLVPYTALVTRKCARLSRESG